jgi:uncharacterized protein
MNNRVKKVFLQAEWRKLAMVNYAIDPDVLIKYLPYKTELDLWGETCYASLVGFMFLNTRLKGIKIPFHSNFEEVNLRFYVRYRERDEWKRGVVFVKEIVPRPALTFVRTRSIMRTMRQCEWIIRGRLKVSIRKFNTDGLRKNGIRFG